MAGEKVGNTSFGKDADTSTQKGLRGFNKVLTVPKQPISTENSRDFIKSYGTKHQSTGAEPPSSRIFVSRLRGHVTRGILIEALKPFGRVLDARIVATMKEGGSWKRFAFCDLESPAAATAAISALHGSTALGQPYLLATYSRDTGPSPSWLDYKSQQPTLDSAKTLAKTSHAKLPSAQKSLPSVATAAAAPPIAAAPTNLNAGATAYPSYYNGGVMMPSTPEEYHYWAMSVAPYMNGGYPTMAAPPAGGPSTTLYVRGLPIEMDELGLAYFFMPFGGIVATKILRNLDTLHSRGEGFVEFATRYEAMAALKATHERVCDGRELCVSIAERQLHTSRGGYYAVPYYQPYAAGMPPAMVPAAPPAAAPTVPTAAAVAAQQGYPAGMPMPGYSSASVTHSMQSAGSSFHSAGNGSNSVSASMLQTPVSKISKPGSPLSSMQTVIKHPTPLSAGRFSGEPVVVWASLQPAMLSPAGKVPSPPPPPPPPRGPLSAFATGTPIASPAHSVKSYSPHVPSRHPLRSLSNNGSYSAAATPSAVASGGGAAHSYAGDPSLHHTSSAPLPKSLSASEMADICSRVKAAAISVYEANASVSPSRSASNGTASGATLSPATSSSNCNVLAVESDATTSPADTASVSSCVDAEAATSEEVNQPVAAAHRH